jgi:hypothetical protein
MVNFSFLERRKGRREHKGREKRRGREGEREKRKEEGRQEMWEGRRVQKN